jgi:hypothetical protein
MKQLFGKYRGVVENNIDPMVQGRIQVSVPQVLGQGKLSWAMPCVPMAGPQMGVFAIPPKGANVWVEFEAGDANMPIWSGCFWGTGEFPTTPPVPPGMSIAFIKTKLATLTLSDLPGVGGVTLEFSPTYKIAMTATGIEITNGQGATIALGPGPKVSVNNGALEVLF